MKSSWVRRDADRRTAIAISWSIWFVWRERSLDRAVFAVAEGVLALQDRVYLACALVDDRRPSVAQEALGRILGRVPVRSMNLDGVVGGVEGRVGRVLLCHRNVPRVPEALVLHPRDLEIQEAADLVVARHPGDHLLDELVPTDLLSERLPLARVLHRRVEASAHRAGGPSGNCEAAVVEAAHRDLEAIA